MSYICADCGVDTTPSARGQPYAGKWEHYMVRPAVWKAAGMPASKPEQSSGGSGLVVLSLGSVGS